MKRKFFKKKNIDFLDPDEILADSASVFGSLISSEGKLERPIDKFFSTFFLLLIGVGLFYLTAQAASLQIQEGEKNFARSQENRFLVRPVLPPRGIIFDRRGKPLVENHPSFGLVLEKEEFLRGERTLPEVLEELGSLLDKPRDFFLDLGFPADDDPERLPLRILLAQGITPEKIRALAPRIYALPGVQIYEEFRRDYKYPYALSHLLGFVGQVSPQDLLKNDSLLPQDTIGKSGVELAYDEALRGKVGKKIVEIDASGRETRFRMVESPKVGSDFALTADGELQRTVYQIMDGYLQGAKAASAVFVDPRDGAVRALVSYPGFDISGFGGSLSAKEFEKVAQNPLKPFFNRAISGEFPPGSTFKTLVGVAVLEENIIDPQKTIYDPGYIEIPHPYRPGEVSRFRDWRPNPQPRWVDFYDAIAQSANVYFYAVGGGFREQKGLGIENIKRYAAAFGLGSLLGIDLSGERPGLIPDPEWKKIAEPNDPIWRVGDTYNVSIGQGGLKTTPLQMAMVASALANGGKIYRPRVLASREKEVLHEGMVNQEAIAQMAKGMRQTSITGTAKLLGTLPVAIASKTGTAEAGSGLTHSWLIGFAPIENPEIAFSVMVEHAGEKSAGAIAIAHDILKWYFTMHIPY